MANLTVTSNVKLKRWIKLMNFVVQHLLLSSLDKRSVNAKSLMTNMSSHIILASSDSGAVGRFLHMSLDDANDLPVHLSFKHSQVLRISGALKSVKYWVGRLPFLIPHPMESQIPTASLEEMSELLDNGCARTLVCDNTIYEMGI